MVTIDYEIPTGERDMDKSEKLEKKLIVDNRTEYDQVRAMQMVRLALRILEDDDREVRHGRSVCLHKKPDEAYFCVFVENEKSFRAILKQEEI